MAAGRIDQEMRKKIEPAAGHGCWVNKNDRYWESDPVLTTAYALIALQLLIDGQGVDDAFILASGSDRRWCWAGRRGL